MNQSDLICQKPHFLNLFMSSGFAAAVCALLISLTMLFRSMARLHDSPVRAVVFLAAAIASAAWAASCVYRHRHSVWSVEAGRVRAASPSREKWLAVDGICCVEVRRPWVCRLFGCVRMKLCAEGGKGAWLSVIVKKEQAEALTAWLKKSFISDDPCRPGYFSQGSHSAAISALTAERPLLMLVASALLTAFSGGEAAMDLSAAALFLLAVAGMIRIGVGCRNLSMTSDCSGYTVSGGISGRRTVYVPARAAAGVCVKYSPAGVLCGAGSMELVCSGGRRIPFAKWVTEKEQQKATLGILGAAGNGGSLFSDADGLRRDFFSDYLLCLSLSVTAAVMSITGRPGGGWMLASAVFALCCGGLRCFTGFRLAEKCGMEVTPSFFRAGGVKYCGAELLYLRRGRVDGARISSPLFRRMNDLCSVMLLAGGRKTGLWCRRVSLSALGGMMGRFI